LCGTQLIAEGTSAGHRSSNQGLDAVDFINSTTSAQVYSIDGDGLSFGGLAACLSYSGSATFASLFEEGACVPLWESREVINRCVFKNDEVRDVILADLDDNEYVRNFVSDLLVTRRVIFGFGFVVALVLGFLFLYILEIPCLAAFVIWSMVLGILVVLVICGALLIRTGNEWEDDDSRQTYEVRGIRAIGYIFAVGAFLYFCVIVCMREQINLAIGLVKEAAKAMQAMRTIVFIPFLQAFGFGLFMVPWVFYILYLASLGDQKVKQFDVNGVAVTAREYEFDNEVQRSGWYMLFIFMWTSQFIIAVGHLTIATAVATWFFTRDKSYVHSGTPFRSVGLVLRFHTGTAAFGALILAIVQIIRAVITYMQKKAKESGNKVAEYILCLCQCCFWCFEKCVKFLSQNAYIQTAIFGKGFCSGAKDAFFLILRNFLRVGALTAVGGFVMSIGKIFIVSIATAGSFFLIEEIYGDEINGLFLPVLFVFILSYYTADMFLDIYEIAMMTVLQCFIADEEMFGSENGFASDSIKSYIHDSGKSKDTKNFASV